MQVSSSEKCATSPLPERSSRHKAEARFKCPRAPQIPPPFCERKDMERERATQFGSRESTLPRLEYPTTLTHSIHHTTH